MTAELTAPSLLARHLRALALRLQLHDPPLAARLSWGLLLLHLAGLLAIVRLTHQPAWLGLVVVLGLQPLLVAWKRREWQPRPECLAPMGLAYAVLGLRLVVAVIARLQGLTSGPLSVPEPWGSLLDLNSATAVAALWALQAQAGLTAQVFGYQVWGQVLAACLALPALAWALVTYPALATRGVTGSDPYAYVQMALDLAQRGLPVHVFELVPKVFGWQLPVWPAVPVGYTVLELHTGLAATVWPPGYSAWLALAWLLAGEAGLYLLTPLLALAALVALAWLGQEALREWGAGWRYLAIGVALFLLATSRQQIEWLAVPMADIPAQLCSILAIACALRAGRGQLGRMAFLAGVWLGWAFAIRYTQALLAVAVALGLAFAARRQPRPLRAWLVAGLCCAAGAALSVAPVLAYHTLVFGGPFQVGSGELSLFDWQHMPSSALAVLRDLLRTNEFAFLLPFLLWGALRTWRLSPRAASLLLAWLAPIVLFHLPYAALRTRDLLSVLPILALWTGVGVADVLARTRQFGPRGRGWAWLGVCLLVIGLLWARTRFTFQLNAGNFTTFGYLRSEQRAAFDSLAYRMPAEAVVAASLNAGAIQLYTGRPSVRAAYWTADEWLAFAERAQAAGYRLYLLEDGVEMQAPRQALESRYPLTLIAELPLPYFERTGSTRGVPVRLYEVGLASRSGQPTNAAPAEDSR